MSEQECFLKPPMVTLNKQLFVDTRHLLNVSSYSQTITVLQINKEFRSCTAVPPESLCCSCSMWREELVSASRTCWWNWCRWGKMVVLYRNAIVLIGFLEILVRLLCSSLLLFVHSIYLLWNKCWKQIPIFFIS